MGGHAFQVPGQDGQPPLNCVRMTTTEYVCNAAHVMKILNEHFELVKIAPHAPEKTSHGDIDLLVCSPKGALRLIEDIAGVRKWLQDVTGAAGSRQSRDRSDRPTVFLALPMLHPKDDNGGGVHDTVSGQTVRLGATQEGKKKFEQVDCGTNLDTVKIYAPVVECEPNVEKMVVQTPGNTYIQVDLIMVDAPTHVPWSSFSQAYGDLDSILRRGLRKNRFALFPSGFYLRIKRGSASSRVFLSNDLDQILQFLFGKGWHRYHEGFNSLEDLFLWIVSSKYFDTEAEEDTADNESKKDKPTLTQEIEQSGGLNINNETPKRSWAEKYDSRFMNRSMYAVFWTEWLTSHVKISDSTLSLVETDSTALSKDDGYEAKARSNNDVVITEALQHFQAHDRYWTAQQALEIKERTMIFWRRVHDNIPAILRVSPHPSPPPSKGSNQFARDALNHIVVFEERWGRTARPFVMQPPYDKQPAKPEDWIKSTKEGGFTEDELYRWIEVHLQELTEAERARTRDDRHAKRESRTARRKAKEREERTWRFYVQWCVCTFGLNLTVIALWLSDVRLRSLKRVA